MPAQSDLDLLFDEYLPFRLYADHKNGKSLNDLATEFLLPAPWIEERIQAARLCIEKQIRLECHSDRSGRKRSIGSRFGQRSHRSLVSRRSVARMPVSS
jgi:hypothetical protein